ncbi:universal stress protein [Croceitalea rosinachiae]|uniref:Universal stress protein n=1 Tax=Croceitalea rosinachiae TaxID=3075596 RepID=A0ABU3A6G1_9FLAO|nr:universal stress protein [Croceitalea sp. F388]MDT0605749.1 universal stress protein [Croceitalea sp. F388]
MSNIKKILIPFDFTEPALAALSYTLDFIGFENPIQVQAVYASTSEVSDFDKKKAEEDFDNIVKSLNKRTTLKPQILVAVGDLVDVILTTRKEQKSDLVIMGTLGDISIDAHVTNTSKLVLEVDCPVITIPFGSEIMVPKEIALVLGKEEIEDPKVLSLLLQIARSFNAKVHVLTIYKESIYGENVIVESNEDTLEYYLEHFYSEHNFEKNQDIEQGILDYIEEKNIDLLAILPRNHAQKTKASEGRLTKLLTLHSTVPVLTID